MAGGGPNLDAFLAVTKCLLLNSSGGGGFVAVRVRGKPMIIWNDTQHVEWNGPTIPTFEVLHLEFGLSP